MSKKPLNLQDYDHLIEMFAQELWLLRELWLGIEEIRRQFNDKPNVFKQFPRFFDWNYRSKVHELYTRIYKLIDKNGDVESLLKLLNLNSKFKPKIGGKQDKFNNLELEFSNKLETLEAVIKLKKYRNNILTHRNSLLIFNKQKETEFRKVNNIQPNEIEELFDFLEVILKILSKRGTFHPLVLPQTNIREEIKEIFIRLDTPSDAAS